MVFVVLLLGATARECPVGDQTQLGWAESAGANHQSQALREPVEHVEDRRLIRDSISPGWRKVNSGGEKIKSVALAAKSENKLIKMLHRIIPKLYP
jgi:hypothetical protein